MRIALHPTKNEAIRIDQYIKEFGRRPLLGEDLRERARCSFCPAKLTDVAGKTDDTMGHFAHWPKSGYCPSKEPAGRPYLRLTPVNPNPEWARYLKTVFLEKWEQYYIKLGKLVPLLSIDEFFALVHEANRLRVWEYHHLTPWEIPYTFVLMNDFPTTNSQKRNKIPQRKYWFRFWYDSSVSSLDDLWINREDDPVLFRASFIQPMRKGAVPKLDALVDFYPLVREKDYLTEPLIHPIPEWIKLKVGDRLPHLLGI
jgi:hypothetical protein